MIGVKADEHPFFPECPYCGEKSRLQVWAHPYENREVVRCESVNGCDRLYVVQHSIKVEKNLNLKIRKIEGE